MERVSSLPPRSGSFPQFQEGESLLLVLLENGNEKLRGFRSEGRIIDENIT